MGAAKLPEKISERLRFDELEQQPSHPSIEASKAKPAKKLVFEPRENVDPQKVERAAKQRKDQNRKRAVRATDQNLIKENIRMNGVIKEQNIEIRELLKKLDLLKKAMRDLQALYRSTIPHHTQSPQPPPRSSQTR